MKIFQVPPYLGAAVFLIGASIGAGMFSIPYAIFKIGALPALGFFLILGAVQIIQHILFAEATIVAKGKAEFAGLAKKYLGGIGEKVAAVVWFGSLWSTQLVYILAGGVFLHALLHPMLGGDPYWYALAWGSAASLLIFRDLRVIVKFSEVATYAMILAVLAVVLIVIRQIDPANLAAVASPTDAALPFGAILFSFMGFQAICQMHAIVKGDAKQLRSAVIAGTGGTIFVTALFSYAMFGLAGAGTTPDIVGGLVGTAFERVLSPALAFIGFLAILTSFLPAGANLRASFQKDFRLSRLNAWLAASVVPMAFFLAGLTRFERVIEFSGAIFGGLTAIIVVLVYVVMARTHASAAVRRYSVPAAIASLAVVLAGASLETWKVVASLF